MKRLLTALRQWWSRRTVQFRTSAVAALVALVGLLVIARISAGFIGWLSLESVDARLNATATTTAERVASGAPPARLAGEDIRVLNTLGEPVDGRGPTGLRPWEINDLKAGEGVTQAEAGDRGAQRWVGTVVPNPQGRPRLVLAGTDLVAYDDLRTTANYLLGIGSVLAATTVGAATWIVVRRSLRPVQRMRAAAAELPEGRRLPVPEPDDELRALAVGLNDLLARRDADTGWLRRFTGDAAHELRNPVGSIRAQAEVAVLHPDPDVAQETLQDIATEAQRLSELVDGLLALARAETGAQPPARQVELVAAVRLAVDRANTAGARPRVQFVTTTSAIVVLATPHEVSTIVDNLISNALRYARALVRVSLLPSAGTVRLLVDDDGPGIPEEHRAQVFDRFHRVRQDRADGSGGAGIGLALVSEAVRRRDGSVRALESPEGGTRIEVRWPSPQ